VNRSLLPLAAFALLAIVLGVGIKNSKNKGIVASPLIGRAAPDFVLPNLVDPERPFDSRSMRGKWHVLNVWGTWCVECRAEHAALMAAKESGALPIVGLNWKDDRADALDWLAQLGDPYVAIPVDADGRVAIDYGVYGALETFLIDPQGVIVHKQIGAMTAELWQRDFVARATGR